MYRFHLPTMSCGGCLASVTRILQTVDPAATVEGDLSAREIAVRSTKDEAVLIDALHAGGYQAEPLQQPVG
jgi:copper chaperone